MSIWRGFPGIFIASLSRPRRRESSVVQCRRDPRSPTKVLGERAWQFLRCLYGKIAATFPPASESHKVFVENRLRLLATITTKDEVIKAIS
jgi:hypothetical protein